MNGLAWRKIYGTLVGWAVFIALNLVISSISINFMDSTSFESSFTVAAISLVLLIASAIVSVKVARKLNRKMMAESTKNQEVIRRYLNGDYEYMIPDKMKTEAGRQRILELLTSGRATSVKGAVLMAKKKKVDRAVGGALLGSCALLVRAGNRIAEEAMTDMAQAIAGPVGNVVGGIQNGTLFDGLNSAPVTTDNTFAITQAKNKAVFMETQARNKAMAAPGSYEAKRAENLAQKQRYIADHMR